MPTSNAEYVDTCTLQSSLVSPVLYDILSVGSYVATGARPPTYLQDLLLECMFDCLLVQTRVNVVSVAQSIEIVSSRHDRTAYRGVPCHICNKQHTIFSSNR